MRKLLVILAAAILFLTSWNAYPEDANIPEIKKDCSSCHVSHTMAAGVLLRAEPSELCLECHPDRQTSNNHAVDIKPSMPVNDLPLSKTGLMTCITCHDPHGKGGFPKMLRARQGKLCKSCHKM